MKIFVKVNPKSKQSKIEKIDDSHFAVWVKEVPEKGKANQAVICLLADYFNLPSSRLRLVSGFRSRKKIIEIK